MSEVWKNWFDELREDEVLVMIAIARKKYNERLKSGRGISYLSHRGEVE